MRTVSFFSLAALLAGMVWISPPATADEIAPLPAFVVVDTDPPLELVLVRGGEFTMGADEEGKGFFPPHEVRVGDFYLGRYEVTQSQWKSVMGDNPSFFKDCDDCPAEQVSWEDAREFLRRAKAPPGVVLRLPTEAEWEYAARGGRAHGLWPGAESVNDVGEVGWYSGSFAGKTRPVGLKEANAFGLYDMAGNVGEWCGDWYDASYYRDSPAVDPRGPASGERKVVRGGSWLSSPYDMRVFYRSMWEPETRNRTIGFRAAADAPSR